MNGAGNVTVETDLNWYKSSYSGAEGGECVEIAAQPGTILVRDSKLRSGPVLAVGADAWADFVRLAAQR